MLVVAGLSLVNLKPHVWDPSSPYYLPKLRAVMISYADFHRSPSRRRAAMEKGLHAFLNVPKDIQIYLDNGAFYFLARTRSEDHANQYKDYEEFVAHAKPDWWPIPQDYIPTPKMTQQEQEQCFQRTMEVNRAYQHDGFAPVIHISRYLESYTTEIIAIDRLAAKPRLALGGIVPNLLRAPKAMSCKDVLKSLGHVRNTFTDKNIHVFGIGGTATIHIAALLKIDSADSSGWRNRAARGMIQLPGRGERIVSSLGNWRGRAPSEQEWERLRHCPCPACKQSGIEGLKARGMDGFCNRATHNLWVLLEEAEIAHNHLEDKSYPEWYKHHLDNTTYLPLIEQLVGNMQQA